MDHIITSKLSIVGTWLLLFNSFTLICWGWLHDAPFFFAEIKKSTLLRGPILMFDNQESRLKEINLDVNKSWPNIYPTKWSEPYFKGECSTSRLHIAFMQSSSWRPLKWMSIYRRRAYRKVFLWTRGNEKDQPDWIIPTLDLIVLRFNAILTVNNF